MGTPARAASSRAAPPFTLTAPHGSEDDLHEATAKLLDLMLLAPVQWTTFPAGGYGLSNAAAARLYRLGLKPAWPDIIIVYRGIYGIELKGWGGELSRTRQVRHKRTGRTRTVIGQETMHLWLRAAGMELAVCRSLNAVVEQVRTWKLPARPVAL